MWREVFRKPQYFTPWITNFMINGNYLVKFKMVGHKVFYYHRVPKDYWENLANDSNTIIIHLVRENYLNTYISQREATASTKWESFDSVKTEQSTLLSKLHINTEDLLAFLDKNQKLIDGMDTLLSGRENVLRITYEEMVKTDGFNRISSFLATYLETTKFGTPINKRQAKLPLEERIANLEEIRAVLANNRWKTLLQFNK